MASHFTENRKYFDIEGSNTLRNCQLGSIWAIKSHFTNSNHPALISLPTGSGKTAIMICLAFELNAEKVLVVTPSVVIRNQIATEFQTLDILKQTKVLSKKCVDEVKVLSNSKVFKSEAIWKQAIEKNDVIVATPKTVSPAERDVSRPPQKNFDLILVDEAHHTPADTWNAITCEFEASKIVFLTATPFRRDKKRIRAKLVYHYSMGKAIQDQIYRKIEFRPVDSGLHDRLKDRSLAEATLNVLNEEKKRGNRSLILIKTDKISKTAQLVDLYRKLGINVEAVHSENSEYLNTEIIAKCKNFEYDGIVAVGMLGEGLDIPALKIAVLHEVPNKIGRAHV